MCNDDKYFNTAHLNDNLKNRTIRGGAITVISQGITFILRMSSTVIMARLLTPEDYGLVGMVTAITGFITLFKDLGLSSATIQKEHITHNQVSTLFWFNIAISTLLMGIVLILAPVISWFYQESRLSPITIFLSFTFLFSGFAVQHQALLRRQMRFGRLAFIQILSFSISLICAIFTAWMGMKHWSLIIKIYSFTISEVILLWVTCKWRPGLPKTRSGVRSMLKFGANLSGFNMVNYFSRNLDNVLIGHYWGAQSVGYYDKAYQLLLLPISQLTWPLQGVAVPALSRIQNDPERYRRYYLNAISLISFIGMPLGFFLVVSSSDIIMMLLGDKWAKSIPIFTILGLSAPIQIIYATNGWLHISQGRTDRMFIWGLLSSFLIVTAFFIGIPHGAMGVSIAYTTIMYIITFPSIWFAGKPIHLRLLSIFSAIWRYYVSACLACLLSFFVLQHINYLYFLRIVISLVITISMYSFFVIIFHQSLKPFKDLSSFIKVILPS